VELSAIFDNSESYRGTEPALIHRLTYGSFLGQKFPFLYMESPKCACTTMKKLLVALEEKNFRYKHVGFESSLEMSIHDRSLNPLANILSLTPDQTRHYLYSPDVVRFCIVRNPYIRLASAWADKIRLSEPGYRETVQEIYTHHFDGPCPAGYSPRFREFVLWMVSKQDSRTCDSHWQSQISLLLPELIQYSHVVRNENLVPEFQLVLDSLGYTESTAQSLLKSFKSNEAPPLNWEDLYTEELANLVYDFYREDFIYYRYNKDSWQHEVRRKAERIKRYKPEDISEKYVEEIIIRNETIATLKHELDKLRQSNRPEPEPNASSVILGRYINLESSLDRRQTCISEIESANLAGLYTRLPAISGAEAKAYHPDSPYTDGKLGCWLSHLEAIKQSFYNNNHLHILEDDFVFTPKFSQFYNDFDSLLSNLESWDIIFCDIDLAGMHNVDQMNKLIRRVVKLEHSGKIELANAVPLYAAGNSSYIVNRTSKKKVYELMENGLDSGLPNDLYLRKLLRENKLIGYVTLPFVTSISNQFNDSTILGDIASTNVSIMLATLFRRSLASGADTREILKTFRDKINQLKPISDRGMIYAQLVAHFVSDDYKSY
jgi:GR25 family glycosyltransferase involved in LPS biosynthesis